MLGLLPLLIIVALIFGGFYYWAQQRNRAAAAAQTPAPGGGRRISLLTEAMAYVGSILVLAGAITAIGQRWEDMTDWGHVGVWATNTTHRRPGPRRHQVTGQHPRRRWLASPRPQK